MTLGDNIANVAVPFNYLVGSWQVQRHIDSDERVLMGEVDFSTLFDGQAAQDVWTVPAPRGWEDGFPDGGFRGTTVYSFDHATNVVHSVWIDPDQHVVLRFTGTMNSTGFVLVSDDETIHAKWQLQLTSESSATWHAYRADSGDGPWTLWEVMQLTRVATR